MKKTLNKFVLAGLALLTASVTSCVDDDYDLSKDIDMTMTLGGNYLAIPNSSTEQIPLRDIIELKAGSAFDTIKVDGKGWENSKQGDYYIFAKSENFPIPDWRQAPSAMQRVPVQIPSIVNQLAVTGVPDFLKESDPNLDLAQLVVTLDITNRNPFAINLDEVVLTSSDEDGLIKNLPIGLTGKTIPAYASNYSLTIIERQGIESPNIVVEPDLSTLLARIPDLITSTITMEDVNVPNGTSFNPNGIAIETSLLAPISFGQDFVIDYEDVIDDWNSDIKDIEIRKMEVTVKAENEIPLHFQLAEMVAIDVDGNDLPDVNVSIDPANDEIAGGKRGMPGQGTMKVTLTSKAGAMKTLDGLRYKLHGTAETFAEGTSMNASQTLKFRDIKLVVRDGIKIDFNDDEDEW